MLVFTAHRILPNYPRDCQAAPTASHDAIHNVIFVSLDELDELDNLAVSVYLLVFTARMSLGKGADKQASSLSAATPLYGVSAAARTGHRPTPGERIAARRCVMTCVIIQGGGVGRRGSKSRPEQVRPPIHRCAVTAHVPASLLSIRNWLASACSARACHACRAGFVLAG